jgi:hypothetical protein
MNFIKLLKKLFVVCTIKKRTATNIVCRVPSSQLTAKGPQAVAAPPGPSRSAPAPRLDLSRPRHPTAGAAIHSSYISLKP